MSVVVARHVEATVLHTARIGAEVAVVPSVNLIAREVEQEVDERVPVILVQVELVAGFLRIEEVELHLHQQVISTPRY